VDLHGRLLEWYGDFNRVRTAHYQPAGWGAGRGPISGEHGDSGALRRRRMPDDVLALEINASGSAVATPIIHSSRQDQSFNYGSAFSRGMTLEIEGRRTVHISGTASINPRATASTLATPSCKAWKR